MKIFPFLFCPAKNRTPVSSGHRWVVWIPQAELRGTSSFLHDLSEASSLCVPTSCANPSLSHFAGLVCLGKTVVLLSGTSAVRSAGGRQGEKWCSELLLGPKQSHQVILYMDRDFFYYYYFLFLFFARGWIRQSVLWDPSPRLGHHGQCCASEPSRAPTAQIPCVFSAGVRAVSVISNLIFPVCTKSSLRIFGWQLHFCVAFERLNLFGQKGEPQPSLLLFAWQQPGET